MPILKVSSPARSKLSSTTCVSRSFRPRNIHLNKYGIMEHRSPGPMGHTPPLLSSPGTMQIIESIAGMKHWRAANSARTALVPTMGFLHEGHLSLVRTARERAERVAVSIFVNPAQFGPSEDFASYPRDFQRDAMLLEAEGIDVIFHPSAEQMYPAAFQTQVDVQKLGPVLCGVSRPGHFRGVATIVLKLFNIVHPDIAVFGRKDYQQLQVIQRMARDLDLDVEIVPHPTVREPDGLAMSSRNAYLNPAERQAATCLIRSLKAGKALLRKGERRGAEILAAVRAVIEKEPLARIEYVALIDPDSLAELRSSRGPA